MTIVAPEVTTPRSWDLALEDETLIKVRRLVEDGKWCKNEVHRPDGRMCIGGMLGYIRTGNPMMWVKTGQQEILKLEWAINEVPQPPRMYAYNFITFNNTRKGPEEIIKWIDRALQL